MASYVPGRFTAPSDEPVVVFLIGMRINRIWAVRDWLQTFRAMGTMLSNLYKHPEKGFLGGQTFLYWRGIGLIQYWRSFEDLDNFARHPSEPHLPAWKKFNQTAKKNGSVGIWHETYRVEPQHYEAVYGNMPVFGLAAVTKHVPATGQYETARRRMGGQNEPAVASE